MNKKRELVNTVLDKLEKANIVLPVSEEFDLSETHKLRCSDSDTYWKQNPEGHRREDDACIEQELACLDEHSLEEILAVGDIPEGVQWQDLWKTWGAAGCFQCAPVILEDKYGIPVLRIRHDSYLSWFRGYAFQNSYDLYGNGSNGSSASDLQLAMKCITAPYYDLEEERAKWDNENALFRKALILSYPFSAAGNQQSFHKMLQNHPEVFEEFIRQTDRRRLRLDLDSSMTLQAMREQASETKFEGPILEEIALIRQDGYGVILRYSEDAVSVSWSEHGENHTMAIDIPKSCSRGGSPSTRHEYLYCTWVGLTITLLTLAGGRTSYMNWVPGKKLASTMDKIPVSIFPKDHHVESIRGVWDKLYELSVGRR